MLQRSASMYYWLGQEKGQYKARDFVKKMHLNKILILSELEKTTTLNHHLKCSDMFST